MKFVSDLIGLRCRPEKTYLVDFTSRRKQREEETSFYGDCPRDAKGVRQPMSVTYEGQRLKFVDHHKSLGLSIDGDGSWNTLVGEKVKHFHALDAALRVLRRLGADVRMLRNVYNALATPALTYCITVWYPLSAGTNDSRSTMASTSA